MPPQQKIRAKMEGKHEVKVLSEETAQQIALKYVKKRKNVERINISTVQQKDGVWIISGTCPINLQGHPWTEKFEITVDRKGKIKTTDFALL